MRLDLSDEWRRGADGNYASMMSTRGRESIWHGAGPPWLGRL